MNSSNLNLNCSFLTVYWQYCIIVNYSFKGTVARDVLTQVFFMDLLCGTQIQGYKDFDFCFVFAKPLKFFEASAGIQVSSCSYSSYFESSLQSAAVVLNMYQLQPLLPILLYFKSFIFLQKYIENNNTILAIVNIGNYEPASCTVNQIRNMHSQKSTCDTLLINTPYKFPTRNYYFLFTVLQ